MKKNIQDINDVAVDDTSIIKKAKNPPKNEMVEKLMNIFEFKEGITVTCFIDKETNKSWFKSKDIALHLEYDDTDQAIRKNVIYKYKKKLSDIFRTVCQTGLKINEKNTIYINKCGIMQLIFASKMKKAEEFQEWIIEDVIDPIIQFN